MGFIQQLSYKIRYKSLVRLFHDVLMKLGIKISFFYLVEEALRNDNPEFELNKFPGYTVEYLGEDDLRLIGSLKERPYPIEKFLQKLKNGCKCLGVKKDNNLVAFTWFDINNCIYEGYPFALKENEAYLFDAYTLIEYRGKKIAPFIRYQCYKELNRLGKTTFYSISEVLNKQSINFKKKLDAKFILLGLYIRLFNKIKLSIPLRNLTRKRNNLIIK
jgi:hypothetical protein